MADAIHDRPARLEPLAPKGKHSADILAEPRADLIMTLLLLTFGIT